MVRISDAHGHLHDRGLFSCEEQRNDKKGGFGVREALRGFGAEALGSQRLWGQAYSATGQGRIIQRVRIPSRKVSQPPGSESLEGGW